MRRKVGQWRIDEHDREACAFGEREIACDSEESARLEAQRQQSADDATAEWIYLRNADGAWVARRVPRDWPQTPISFRRALLEWLTNPFDWL